MKKVIMLVLCLLVALTPVLAVNFPAYTGGGDSIVNALDRMNINSSFDFRAKIAVANGIWNYRGTTAQNYTMLYLLKTGQLVQPSVPVQNPGCYPVYTGKSYSIVDALKQLGYPSQSTFAFRTEIAKKNAEMYQVSHPAIAVILTNYTGSWTQNTMMMQLLRNGRLYVPTVPGSTVVNNLNNFGK